MATMAMQVAAHMKNHSFHQHIRQSPPDGFRIDVVPGAGNSKVGSVVEYAVVSFSGEPACPKCGCILVGDADACPDCGRRIEIGAL